MLKRGDYIGTVTLGFILEGRIKKGNCNSNDPHAAFFY